MFINFELFTEDLVCVDEDFEEIYLKLSKERDDIREIIDKGQDKGKDVYVTVLEGPHRNSDNNIEILQIVTKAEAREAQR